MGTPRALEGLRRPSAVAHGPRRVQVDVLDHGWEVAFHLQPAGRVRIAQADLAVHADVPQRPGIGDAEAAERRLRARSDALPCPEFEFHPWIAQSLEHALHEATGNGRATRSCRRLRRALVRVKFLTRIGIEAIHGLLLPSTVPLTFRRTVA